MKSVKVTTIKNHEAIWKSSKLSFPIWFCPCSTEPRILFRDSFEVTGFFFPNIPGVFWCYYGKVTCWLTVWSLGRSFGSGLLSLWCLKLMDTDGAMYAEFQQMSWCIDFCPFQNDIHFFFGDIPDISVNYWVFCLAKPHWKWILLLVFDFTRTEHSSTRKNSDELGKINWSIYLVTLWGLAIGIGWTEIIPFIVGVKRRHKKPPSIHQWLIFFFFGSFRYHVWKAYEYLCQSGLNSSCYQHLKSSPIIDINTQKLICTYFWDINICKSKKQQKTAISPPVKMVEKNVIHKSTSFFFEASWFRKEIAWALHRRRGASTLGKENSDHWSFWKNSMSEDSKKLKKSKRQVWFWICRWFRFTVTRFFFLKKQQGIIYNQIEDLKRWMEEEWSTAFFLTAFCVLKQCWQGKLQTPSAHFQPSYFDSECHVLHFDVRFCGISLAIFRPTQLFLLES